MPRKLAMLLALIIVLSGFGATGWSQAAAEYGMAAGAAAGAAATAADKATSALSTAVDKVVTGTADAQKEAARSLPAPVATKPLETIMKENREKLEATAQNEAAQLQIDYRTAKATVFVDGAPVGYTPFETKLLPGLHLIELRHFNSMPWRKEVSVKQGETLSLKPELQFKKYPSVVTLSAE